MSNVISGSHYASIDDYLGPGESRFFSAGYRRASHSFSHLSIGTGEDGRAIVKANLSVKYPSDWSTKASGQPIVPHLSTVDVLMIAVQMAEIDLLHGLALSAASVRSARVRSVAILAGKSPQEELAGLEVICACRESLPIETASRKWRSTYECRVGAMRARCEIEHDASSQRSRRTANFPRISDALAPATYRYYGDGFKNDRHQIRDISVDMSTLTASARVTVINPRPEGLDHGIEAESRQGPTLVDAFVVCMQLAQILIYELDGIKRADSSTLWMLRTQLSRHEDEHPRAGAQDATASIVSSHVIPLRGERWRNVDLVAQLGGAHMQASFAHKLAPS